MSNFINATIDDHKFDALIEVMNDHAVHLKPVLAAVGNLAVKSIRQNLSYRGSLRAEGKLKNPAEIRVSYLKSRETNKRAIRTTFYNRFKVNGEEFMIEVVTNSGVFRGFTIWTGYKSNLEPRNGECIFRKK